MPPPSRRSDEGFSGRNEGDLKRFRDYIEERGRETDGLERVRSKKERPVWVFVGQQAPTRREWQRNHTGPNMRYPRQRFALGREFKTCEAVGELEFQ